MQSLLRLGAIASILSLLEPSQATPVPISGPQVEIPSLCDNGGLEWAYYNNPLTMPGGADGVFNWMRQMKPLDEGTTSYLSYYQPTATNTAPIYENQNAHASQFIQLEHRGYIFAATPGVYTLRATNIDDLLFTWIGGSAAGPNGIWTQENANQSVNVVPNVATPINVPVTSVGTYLPFRMVYINGPGPGRFELSVIDPNGNELIGGDPLGNASPAVVRYSCDGNLAPRYQPFGSEF